MWRNEVQTAKCRVEIDLEKDVRTNIRRLLSHIGKEMLQSDKFIMVKDNKM